MRGDDHDQKSFALELTFGSEKAWKLVDASSFFATAEVGRGNGTPTTY